MPQPKKTARPPAAKARADAPGAADRRRAAPAPEDVVANLAVLRERLVSSLTLTTDRLQDAVDDAVRRGRMTRRDAEDLLATLVSAGRAQTDQLLADVEALLARGREAGAGVAGRAAESSDAVLRTVDRARRRVGAGAFPIRDYDELTAAQITGRLEGLSPGELRRVRDRERRGAARKTVLAAVQRRLG